MKKALKKILTFAFALFMFLIGLCFGLLLMSYISKGAEGIANLFESLLALILAYNIGIIVHEGGHLVFGLLTGYKFSSFRIWSFMLIKQEGKMKLRRFSLAGTGGQCLMIPPGKGDTKASVILYNLGGVFFNLILAAITLIIYYILPETYLLSSLLWYTAVWSLIAMLSNGIPFNIGGIANDGMNALHLSKNSDAADAFRKQLLMNAAQTEGMRISEMPDEWFILTEGADMQNVHCASIAVFAAQRALDRGDTAAAEQEISALLNGGYNIIGLHRNLLTCDLIYCRLSNDPLAEVRALITPELKKLMQSMRKYPSVIRTQFVIALLVDKDTKKADNILASFDKQTKNFPYRQEIDSERRLMFKIAEKAKKPF